MTPKSSSSQIILASTSRARREMLAAAGVPFTVEAADVDEPAIRKKLLAGKPPATPQHIAEALARAKAEDVSRRHKGSLVIGGDQVLALGNELLTRARDEAAARATLGKLKGKTHELHSAVALAADGKVLWSFFAGAGVNAPPASYSVDGKQYIVVGAGGNTQIDFKRGNNIIAFTVD